MLSDVHGYKKSHCFTAVNVYSWNDLIRETTAFNRVLAALEAAAEYRINFVAKREDVAKFVREVKRLKKKSRK